MKIVDAHIHFWDPDHLRYGWLAEVPAIQRRHLPADLEAQTGPYELAGIVFVQAGAHTDDALAEAKWISGLAAGDIRIQAIVADAPLERGSAVASHLEALATLPLVKGVRRLIQGEPAGFSTSPAFIEAVQMLPDYGLSFDLCVFHPQLPELIQLVDSCPDVSFILDHFGKPDIAGGRLDPWREHIATLASYDNVHCKLSGLITEADHEQWQAADLQPYIDHVVTAFGPERLLFGGDWPVSLLAAESWAHWTKVALESVAALTSAQKVAIFQHNAATFYRFATQE